MSCNEWERGTITLPTAEAVKARNAIKDAVNAYSKNLYDHSQKFWKELPASYKTNIEKYRRAVTAFIYGNKTLPYGGGDKLPDLKLPSWQGFRRDTWGGFTDKFVEDLQQLLEPAWNAEKGKRVIQADIDKRIGKATGTKFTVFCGESEIRWDGRKVTWNVPENNRACEHAREHPLAEPFFKILDRVKWTRGSGGMILGNNEYNEGDYEGAGGNYVVSEYGPKVKRPSSGRYGLNWTGR